MPRFLSSLVRVIVPLFLLAGGLGAAEEPAGRETLNFNQGWRFLRIDAPPTTDVRLPPADLVAEGNFAPGHDPKVIAFKPASARYVAIESTSSQRDGDPHAAIAEFDLLDDAGKPLPRDHWQIAFASSAQPGNPPQAAIDSDPGTFWHSRYSPLPFPRHPHELVIDLGEPAKFAAFRYLPRAQDLPGMIKGFRFFASLKPFPGLPPLSGLDASGAEFPDEAWEIVNVPHTVRLEPYNASGGQNFQGLCWYRKHFTVDASWRRKRVTIEFGGAMQSAEVWLNGRRIASHFGGYLPFHLDLTGQLRFDGDNVIVLRLDNRDQPLVPPGKPQNNLDFTYFGGLYRDVRLVATSPLRITDPLRADKPAGGGIFVTYPRVGDDAATVQVRTEVANGFDSQRDCTVRQQLLDAAGQVVADDSATGQLAAGAEQTFTQRFDVDRPSLWHPDHPYLYRLRTRVYDHGQIADEVVTRIGIRTFRFTPAGLTINGRPFLSIGFNHHQDFPYIGYAVPDSLQYRDVWKMRTANMTSFRSHYPHAESFMDACDELGVLTIVSTPGWQWFENNPVFLDRAYENTREMIRLNRNRPSVILWEVGLNETDYSEAYARESQKIVHDEFPGEPCYSAGDASLPWQKTDPVFDMLYADRFGHLDHPHWWREFGDFYDMNWDDQVSANRVARGYGEQAMLLQASSHERGMRSVLESKPPISGADLWAGIDCDRGYHPTPFLGGILDKARLPKFDYYLFASQRPPAVHVDGIDDGPMVFIANFLNRYSPKDVTVYSNCEEVRLYFTPKDGVETLVATKKVVNDGKVAHAATVFEDAVPALVDRSRLRAEGLIGGKPVAQMTIGSAGLTRKLVLSLDRCGRDLTADGSDIILVRAALEDKEGNVVTFDDRDVTFSATGPADVVGDASIGANPTRSELGIATALIRSRPRAGAIIVRAVVRGLPPAEMQFNSIPLAEPTAAGRDVGRLSQPTTPAATVHAPASRPVVTPSDDVIEAQRKSQDMRKETSRP